MSQTEEWQQVCRMAELEVERGATALVHGQALAIFRTHGDEVFALGNYDPFAKASVLARGIVGSRGTSRSWLHPCTSTASTCGPASVWMTQASTCRCTR